jgi:hypothetical protein
MVPLHPEEHIEPGAIVLGFSMFRRRGRYVNAVFRGVRLVLGGIARLDIGLSANDHEFFSNVVPH